MEAEFQRLLREMVKQVVEQALNERFPSGVPTEDKERLLGVPEAASRLGLAQGTLRNKACALEIASVKVGSRLLFKVADLDAYVAKGRRCPEQVRKLARQEFQRT